MLGIFAARSSTLSKLDSLRNCPFVKANYFKSGCQLLSVALSEKEVIKRSEVLTPPPPFFFIDC